jgi:hypothetical protein
MLNLCSGSPQCDGNHVRHIVAQLTSRLAPVGSSEEKIQSQINVWVISAHRIKYKSEVTKTAGALTACRQQ